jgi:hypothetical protein
MVAHAFGGAFHTPDTIVNIQSKASDGRFITSYPSEIDAFTLKIVPVAGDEILIEDSADTLKKKKITVGSLLHVQIAKITIDHTQFQTAGLTKTNTLYSLPAGAILIGCRLKPSPAWLGGAISAYNLSIGYAGNNQDMMTEYDVMNLVIGDMEYAESQCFQSFDYNNAVSVTVTARSVTANLSASTQGVAVVELIYIPKA